jgi:hypothetical protein
MADLSLLNSTLLSPVTLADTRVTRSGSQPTQPQKTVWSSSSSAQLVTDTYTSSQLASSNSVDSAVSGTSRSTLPQAEDYFTATHQAWQTLEQSMASGDTSSAQTALSDYNQALATSNSSMSALTTPSAAFLKDLTDLGSDLSAGNLTGAQSVFNTAEKDQPESVTQALSTTIAKAISDGVSDPNWMEQLVNFGIGVASASTLATANSTDSATSTTSAASNGGSQKSSGNASPTVTNEEGFNSDLQAIKSLIEEGNANIGSYLQSQGDTSAAVNAEVSAFNLSDTLGLLPGLANDIGQLSLVNEGSLTISNSSEIVHVGSTSTGTKDGVSTTSSVSGSSMYDTFSYSLQRAYINHSTGMIDAVSNSGSIRSGNTTLAANKTTMTLEDAASTSSITAMNQTKNLVEDTMGTFLSFTTNSNAASSDNYILNSSGLSVYA